MLGGIGQGKGAEKGEGAVGLLKQLFVLIFISTAS